VDPQAAVLGQRVDEVPERGLACNAVRNAVESWPLDSPCTSTSGWRGQEGLRRLTRFGSEQDQVLERPFAFCIKAHACNQNARRFRFLHSMHISTLAQAIPPPCDWQIGG